MSSSRSCCTVAHGSTTANTTWLSYLKINDYGTALLMHSRPSESPLTSIQPTLTRRNMTGDYSSRPRTTLLSFLKYCILSSALRFRKLSLRGKVGSNLKSFGIQFGIIISPLALNLCSRPVLLCAGCTNSPHQTCVYSSNIL